MGFVSKKFGFLNYSNCTWIVQIVSCKSNFQSQLSKKEVTFQYFNFLNFLNKLFGRQRLKIVFAIYNPDGLVTLVRAIVIIHGVSIRCLIALKRLNCKMLF